MKINSPIKSYLQIISTCNCRLPRPFTVIYAIQNTEMASNRVLEGATANLPLALCHISVFSSLPLFCHCPSPVQVMHLFPALE